MHVALVLGTARIGRRSEMVAQYLRRVLSDTEGIELSYVDVQEHLKTFATTRYGHESTEVFPWKNIAAEAQGFVFVIPEYSHSYPGEWKLLMDALHEGEYLGKVAGLVGVSDGQFGGARAVEQATLYLAHRGMYIMKKGLFFPRVQDAFNAAGDPVDPEVKVRTDAFITSLKETLLRYQ